MLGNHMVREKIEISQNSLAPTCRPLWHAAVERLHEAETGLQQMKTAKDRVSFEQGWGRSVDSIEEFWTKFFGEGKEKFPNFQPWAGKVVAQRKKDKLLSYLCQARHQNQHGNASLDWDEGKVLIAPDFNGTIQNLAIFPDGTFEMSSKPTPGSSVKATLRFIDGNAKLPTITNRNQIFSPPQQHVGRTYPDLKPVQAVELAIEFYISVLNSAFEKFAAKKEQNA
jgi:hypothetical protein